MTFDQLVEVWNLASVVFAIFAGTLLGALAVGHYASDPSYASGQATPVDYAVLVGVMTTAVGLVFFGFQVLGSFLDDDPLWTRVVSRFGLWVVYSVAIGVGTWARLRWHAQRKRAEVHARADHELNK